MGSLQDLLERTATPMMGSVVETVILTLLLAFVLGQLIAWTYAATHSGLSYSRTFTQSLVLLTMIVSLVMLVIGNNIVTAFGLLGALAIIRFRNVLKDTRDTVFIFLSLVVGMAVGAEKYLTGIAGTAGVLLAALYLNASGFGTLGRYDGHLSFRLAGGPESGGDVLGLLREHCRQTKRISLRQSAEGPAADYVYEVRLRNRSASHEFIEALRAEPGVSGVTLVLHEELSEV